MNIAGLPIHKFTIDMKTILIPVDFSATSANALKYTVELIKDIEVGRIILLKTFYKSVYEQLLPSADFVQLSADDIQQERNAINEQLKNLTENLLKNCAPDIKIQTAISELPLLRSIHQLIADEQPDLLIIGSDGSSADESYIGQHVVSIARTSPAPVLIVPADVIYQPIQKVLLPCDFAAVSRLNVLKSIRNPLNWSKPELLVLNIDPKQTHISHEEEHLNLMEELLEDYRYEIFYSDEQNTVQGILNFARSHGAQLITVLPGKYSFFYKFTHSSTSEALALNSNEPILILK